MFQPDLAQPIATNPYSKDAAVHYKYDILSYMHRIRIFSIGDGSSMKSPP